TRIVSPRSSTSALARVGVRDGQRHAVLRAARGFHKGHVLMGGPTWQLMTSRNDACLHRLARDERLDVPPKLGAILRRPGDLIGGVGCGDHMPYESSWYRCGFATTKGSAVCTHGRGYHRYRLEAAVLVRFRAAMTAPMVSTLTEFVNTQVEAAFRE